MNYSLSLEERRLRIVESGCCGDDGGGGMDDGGEAPEPDTDGSEDSGMLGKVLEKLKKKKKGKK